MALSQVELNRRHMEKLRIENPEEYARRMEANKARSRKRHEEHREEHNKQMLEWQKKNPERHKVHQARWRAKKRAEKLKSKEAESKPSTKRTT